jgi:hypothetical protein
MPIALLVETMVRDEDGFDDRAVLPDRDHGQVFDIEIDSRSSRCCSE